jgi:hypothetical protein
MEKEIYYVVESRYLGRHQGKMHFEETLQYWSEDKMSCCRYEDMLRKTYTDRERFGGMVDCWVESKSEHEKKPKDESTSYWGFDELIKALEEEQ